MKALLTVPRIQAAMSDLEAIKDYGPVFRGFKAHELKNLRELLDDVLEVVENSGKPKEAP